MCCEHIVDTTTFEQLMHKEFHCGLLVPVCGQFIDLQERCCISLIVAHLWLAISARECSLVLCIQ